MGTGDWGLGIGIWNFYSAPTKRPATANSTNHSALITQHFQVRVFIVSKKECVGSCS
ncbi:hypothetical protein [Nostoc sp. CMAA1605]|uniref:hypothetical protein n=1 Tax=Nostoc sp. CMAA1605 TaxID=2055159 RepID=UPI001F392F18|nr:hypothetical protein [Nostoc sp. CMAA1605]